MPYAPSQFAGGENDKIDSIGTIEARMAAKNEQDGAYTTLCKTLHSQVAFTTRNGTIIVNRGFYPINIVVKTPKNESIFPATISGDTKYKEKRDGKSISEEKPS